MNMLSIEEIGFEVQERRVPLQAWVQEAVAVAIFSGKRVWHQQEEIHNQLLIWILTEMVLVKEIH